MTANVFIRQLVLIELVNVDKSQSSGKSSIHSAHDTRA